MVCHQLTHLNDAISSFHIFRFSSHFNERLFYFNESLFYFNESLFYFNERLFYCAFFYKLFYVRLNIVTVLLQFRFRRHANTAIAFVSSCCIQYKRHVEIKPVFLPFFAIRKIMTMTLGFQFHRPRDLQFVVSSKRFFF